VPKAPTRNQIETRAALAEAVRARNAAIAWRNYSLSDRGIRAAVRIAKADPDIRISLDMLDTKGFELNTPDGIVDLYTGKLGPPNPESFHTKVTGAGYDTGADCAKWKAFLGITFKRDKGLIDYMQRLLGYATIGKVTHHILPFFHGSGDNGKSCLLETVSHVLGDYAISAPANFLMAGKSEHATEIARLQGARFVVCSEINQGAKFDEAKVKLLTGGDKLTGRFMRQDFTDFTPTHTLFLVGNHQPTVESGGHALWRRLQVIPFQHRVEKRIDGYDQQLFDEEGPAILAWMVKGVVEVIEKGLQIPEFVKAATKDYEESEDTIGQFIDDCCRRVLDHFKLASGIVWQHYEQWCNDNGFTPKPSNVFGRELRTNYGVKVGKSNGKRYIYGLQLDSSPADQQRTSANDMRCSKDG
jgi:P4 family phage/plasmid primase-like protien